MTKTIHFAIVFLFCVGNLFSQSQCSDFKINDFKINGNTTLSSNEATLTIANNNQSGSIWSNQKIDLSQNFTISVELYFGVLDESGADGIAFVLQPLSSDLGSLGGGIGYQGIVPSLAVEIDTWYNAGYDPISDDHMAIIKNGHTELIPAHSEITPAIALPNVEDGRWHDAIFEWDANTKRFKVTFDNVVKFDITIDITHDFFSNKPEVYWGFTAATGGAINIHKVRLKNYCVTLDSCSTIPGITADKTSICKNENVSLSISGLPTLSNKIIPLQSEFEYIIAPLTSERNTLTGSWQKGKAPFGSEILSPVPGLEANTIWPINSKLYLRKSVNLSNFDLNTLEWKIAVDNGYKLFVNGNFVSQDFQEGYSYFQEYQGAVPSGFLNNGENSIEYELTDTGGLSVFETQVTAIPFYTILWSTGATSPNIDVSPNETTTYWVEITANGNTCRKTIEITVSKTSPPTGPNKQTFCSSKTVGDLVANGTNIVWYPSATSTVPLNNSLLLQNGNRYFASQTISGCESSFRFETLISIVTIPNVTGESFQKFCLENDPNIKNLVVNSTDAKWFTSGTNGTLLTETTKLEDNTTYYAAIIDTASGCESTQRLATTVDLIQCNLIVFNAVKIDASPMSDRLFVDDISYFPENNMKIYNRFGKLIWEANSYNNTTNTFKGRANITTLLGEENLPDGTYFYILSYYNFIDAIRKVKKGYLQIMNSN
jgi:hypothetical protein